MPLPAAAPPAIVISAQALPSAKAERAYGAETIDRRRIDQSPSRQLDQILKEVPGVQLFRRSDSRSGHPTSQGVALRALGGNASSRALLVLDGVPQTDPFGGWINWPAYDPQDLEQIRVVRGGGSVANGPGALAGTIEMLSRRDQGAGAQLDVGSRDSLEAGARAGLTMRGVMLNLSGRFGRSDGFVPVTRGTRGPADQRAPYRDWSARVRWAMPVSSSIDLQASADGFHDRRTRGTDFSQDRTNGADASLRLIGSGAWRWSALAYWQWRAFMSSFASVNASRTAATPVLLQDQVPSNGIGGSFELRPPMRTGIELRLGGDVRRTEGESREFFAFNASKDPTRRRRAGGTTMTSGAFAELSADIGRVTVTGGGRLDHWQVGRGHLRESSIASGVISRDDRYPRRDGWLPTARAGAVVPIGQQLSLRGAAYLGWRMPTLNELFRPFRAGLDATAANPGLDPERLAGAEAGVEYRREGVHLALTAFRNRLRHSIANVTLGVGPGQFPQVGFVPAGGVYRQRQNIRALDSTGVEASAEFTRGPWTLQAGASLTRARMRSGGLAASLDGLRPAQTPGFAATLRLSWVRGERSAELLLRHVGAQFEDDLNSRTLEGASTIDASVAWPILQRIQVVARGENLTNALVMAGIGSDGTVERATPRTLWIGVRIR